MTLSGVLFTIFLGALIVYWLKRPSTPKVEPPSAPNEPVLEPLRNTELQPSVKNAPLSFTVTVAHDSPVPALEQVVDEDKDAWDQAALDLYMSGHRMALPGIQFGLDFTDTSGKQTRRDVDSIAFTHNKEQNSGVLWAFCQLRKANRPFRYSGIQRAVDLESGEIIKDIGAYLQARYDQTPAAAVERFLDEHKDAVYALFCLAKADGFLRKGERNVLGQLIESIGLRDPEQIELLMNQINSEWAPSQGKPFWDAVKAIAERPDAATLMPDLLTRMHQVIATDKKAHDDELKLLRYAAKKWRLPLPD